MKILFLLLLTLLSSSIYSQVIRKIDGEKVVVFILDQAKAVNDTFVYQKKEIERLKNIKPIIKTDTIERIVHIKGEVSEHLFNIEGIIFMIVQGIILIPTLFLK
jgi:hypothetical protein